MRRYDNPAAFRAAVEARLRNRAHRLGVAAYIPRRQAALERLITILFRHIRGEDLALGPGEFPYWPKGSEPARAVFARVEITGSGFAQEKKARIAARIGEALVLAGVPERFVTVVFRDVNPTDVFSGRGVSPF